MKSIHYWLLLKRLGLLMLIYTLSRLFFGISNYSKFGDASWSGIFNSFIYGLRFDASTVFTINILFIALSILPFSFVNRKGYQLFLKAFFLTINFPFILLNLVDIEFFKFTGRRTTFEILGISSDIQDQSGQLLAYYWYIPAGAILLIVLTAYLYPELKERHVKVMKRWQLILIYPFIIFISVMLIRGSLQIKPLLPGHAFIFNNNTLGNMTLNTPFVFFKTMNGHNLQRVNHFPSREAVFNHIQRPALNKQKPNKQNVVLIIMESFATEYMGLDNPYKGYTPFLDSLARAGTYFPNHFANGRRSIDALPAILTSLPALMDESYINSTFQTNELYGLGSVLKKNGYQTAFFHGGKNGTLGFDLFSHIAGFEKYYGLSEFSAADFGPSIGFTLDPNKSGWGISDEPFLLYMANQLNTFSQPFGAAVFTLSSHQPYTIPDEHKNKFPKGTLEIHESIGYADYALKRFFEAASKMPWYKNTLFVITADHTQKSDVEKYNNDLGVYDVPLILFHPQGKIPAVDTTQLCQHADIMPSIIDYLGLKTEHVLPFGSSIFDDKPGFVLYRTYEGKYRLIQNNYILDYFPDKETYLYQFDKDPYLHQHATDEPVKEDYLTKIKAFIQFHNNGLLDNDWYKE